MRDKRSHKGAKYPRYMAEASGVVLTFIKKLSLGTSGGPVVKALQIPAGGMSLTPGWGTNIP